MGVTYPNFVGEVAKRGIKKTAIAQAANMCTKTLRDKIIGKSEFTLPEAIAIRDTFFPDKDLEHLFAKDSGGETP